MAPATGAIVKTPLVMSAARAALAATGEWESKVYNETRKRVCR